MVTLADLRAPRAAGLAGPLIPRHGFGGPAPIRPLWRKKLSKINVIILAVGLSLSAAAAWFAPLIYGVIMLINWA
jgi:hypothetical protein